MAKRKTHSRRKMSSKLTKSFKTSVLIGATLLIGTGFGIIHLVLAGDGSVDKPLNIDPNFGVKNRTIEFFSANDAEEMIPIIKCESRFRHFDRDGNVLQNSSGSSAIGVAQILSSVHPDPRIVERYNRMHNMEMQVADFDITTLDGNLGYALVLYQVNGVRDWECSKKFRW